MLLFYIKALCFYWNLSVVTLNIDNLPMIKCMTMRWTYVIFKKKVITNYWCQ